MKVLFIGGNGNISWWCAEEALKAGHTVYELNRAETRNTRRGVQPEVIQLIADIRDEASVRTVLGEAHFDVVCDFICFNETHAKQAIRLFKGRCGQYVVISSEAVYQRKSGSLPFTEEASQYDADVDDGYIKGKLEVEKTFLQAWEKEAFPVTIVRPGYTYDTIVPAPIGQNCFTAPQFFVNGFPLLMPGDGENLWNPLHSSDFARGFVGLLGKEHTIGEAYHITGEWLMTWNELAETLLDALGVKEKRIIHIPRKEAMEITSFHSKVVMRQHMWHYVFDNAKLRTAVPDWHQRISFAEGIAGTIRWLYEKDERRRINPVYQEALHELYARYGGE